MSSIKFTRLFLAILIVSVFAGSCSKKDGTAVLKSTLLTTSTWKYDDAGLDPGVDGTIDQPFPTGTIQPCQTDFILTFKSDKTGIMDEGPQKCLASDPQTTPFTWDITNNDTELNISASILAGLGSKTKILELTATRMVLATTVNIPGLPITFPTTIILKH